MHIHAWPYIHVHAQIYKCDRFHLNATPPKSTNLQTSNSSVQIRIRPKFQFQF